MKTKNQSCKALLIAAAIVTVTLYSCSGGGKSNKADTITFTTKTENGQSIYLEINADEENKENIWIDLDANGAKDNGEEIVKFGERTEFILKANTITLYGKIKSFSCPSMKISELDVSSSPTLEKLVCGHNMLTALDVSKNPLLKELFCQYNKLTALDLSNNAALVKMNISDNKLTGVTAKAFPGLEYMELHKNDLKKDALVSLFNAFPSYSGNGYSSNGTVLVLSPSKFGDENNEITDDIIENLKKKNWRPFKRESGSNEYY